jgi:hypothetical protein
MRVKNLQKAARLASSACGSENPRTNSPIL